MAHSFVALFVGILFGVGLAISGMTSPHKVIGFLDIFGQWDPSLIFVMVGAIIVNGLSYFFLKKRPRPLLNHQFHLPTLKVIDGKLIIGSVLFGVGWGLTGFCPGPALASLTTMDQTPILFVGSLVAGMAAFEIFQRVLNRSRS